MALSRAPEGAGARKPQWLPAKVGRSGCSAWLGREVASRADACNPGQAFGGREHIFLKSHTNEFVGKEKVGAYACDTRTGPKKGRWVYERGSLTARLKRSSGFTGSRPRAASLS